MNNVIINGMSSLGGKLNQNQDQNLLGICKNFTTNVGHLLISKAISFFNSLTSNMLISSKSFYMDHLLILNVLN